MLSHEFLPDSGNRLWDAGYDRLLEPVVAATGQPLGDPAEYFGSPPFSSSLLPLQVLKGA